MPDALPAPGEEAGPSTAMVNLGGPDGDVDLNVHPSGIVPQLQYEPPRCPLLSRLPLLPHVTDVPRSPVKGTHPPPLNLIWVVLGKLACVLRADVPRAFAQK